MKKEEARGLSAALAAEIQRKKEEAAVVDPLTSLFCDIRDTTVSGEIRVVVIAQGGCVYGDAQLRFESGRCELFVAGCVMEVDARSRFVRALLKDLSTGKTEFEVSLIH